MTNINNINELIQMIKLSQVQNSNQSNLNNLSNQIITPQLSYFIPMNFAFLPIQTNFNIHAQQNNPDPLSQFKDVFQLYSVIKDSLKTLSPEDFLYSMLKNKEKALEEEITNIMNCSFDKAIKLNKKENETEIKVEEIDKLLECMSKSKDNITCTEVNQHFTFQKQPTVNKERSVDTNQNNIKSYKNSIPEYSTTTKPNFSESNIVKTVESIPYANKIKQETTLNANKSQTNQTNQIKTNNALNNIRQSSIAPNQIKHSTNNYTNKQRKSREEFIDDDFNLENLKKTATNNNFNDLFTPANKDFDKLEEEDLERLFYSSKKGTEKKLNDESKEFTKFSNNFCLDIKEEEETENVEDSSFDGFQFGKNKKVNLGSKEKYWANWVEIENKSEANLSIISKQSNTNKSLDGKRLNSSNDTSDTKLLYDHNLDYDYNSLKSLYLPCSCSDLSLCNKCKTNGNKIFYNKSNIKNALMIENINDIDALINNSYDIVIWTLYLLSKIHNDCNLLSLTNIVKLLNKQYEEKYINKKRNAISLLKSKALPNRKVVLLITSIKKMSEGDFEVELSDGYESIFARVKKDYYLYRFFNNNQIAEGMKICIGMFTHIESNESDRTLIELNYNYSSLCSLTKKLGLIKNDIHLVKTLSNIELSGGYIPMIDVIILEISEYLAIDQKSKISLKGKAYENILSTREVLEYTTEKEDNIKQEDESQQNYLQSDFWTSSTKDVEFQVKLKVIDTLSYFKYINKNFNDEVKKSIILKPYYKKLFDDIGHNDSSFELEIMSINACFKSRLNILDFNKYERYRINDLKVFKSNDNKEPTLKTSYKSNFVLNNNIIKKEYASKINPLTCISILKNKENIIKNTLKEFVLIGFVVNAVIKDDTDIILIIRKEENYYICNLHALSHHEIELYSNVSKLVGKEIEINKVFLINESYYISGNKKLSLINDKTIIEPNDVLIPHFKTDKFSNIKLSEKDQVSLSKNDNQSQIEQTLSCFIEGK